LDLALVDLRLPDGDGLDLVAWIEKHHPQLPVAVITAHGNVETAVRNGREPFWRADGKELYYHGPDRWLMAVTLDLTKPTPAIDQPRQLVQLQFRGWDVRYHVAPLPDGSAFVMNVPVPGSTPPPLSFVLNWLTP